MKQEGRHFLKHRKGSQRRSKTRTCRTILSNLSPPRHTPKLEGLLATAHSPLLDCPSESRVEPTSPPPHFEKNRGTFAVTVCGKGTSTICSQILSNSRTGGTFLSNSIISFKTRKSMFTLCSTVHLESFLTSQPHLVFLHDLRNGDDYDLLLLCMNITFL